MQQLLDSYQETFYDPKSLDRIFNARGNIGPWDPLKSTYYNTQPVELSGRVSQFLSSVLLRKITRKTEFSQVHQDTKRETPSKSETLKIQPESKVHTWKQISDDRVLNAKIRSKCRPLLVQAVKTEHKCEAKNPSLPRFSVSRAIFKSNREKQRSSSVQQSLLYLGPHKHKEQVTKGTFTEVCLRVRRHRDPKQIAYYTPSNSFIHHQKLKRRSLEPLVDF